MALRCIPLFLRDTDADSDVYFYLPAAHDHFDLPAKTVFKFHST